MAKNPSSPPWLASWLDDGCGEERKYPPSTMAIFSPAQAVRQSQHLPWDACYPARSPRNRGNGGRTGHGGGDLAVALHVATPPTLKLASLATTRSVPAGNNRAFTNNSLAQTLILSRFTARSLILSSSLSVGVQARRPTVGRDCYHARVRNAEHLQFSIAGGNGIPSAVIVKPCSTTTNHMC